MPRARRAPSDATSSARWSASPYPSQSSSGASSSIWTPDASTPPPEFAVESPPVKSNRTARKVRTGTQEDVITSRRHMSCEGCRVRKSKCSRQSPCTACKLRGETCTWVGPPPAGESGPDALRASLDEIARLKKLVDVLLDRLQHQEEERLGGGHDAAHDYLAYQYGQAKSAIAFSRSPAPLLDKHAFPSGLPPQFASVLGSAAPNQQLISERDVVLKGGLRRQHGSMMTLLRAAKAVDSPLFSKADET